MNILVTGGKGFVGEGLVKELTIRRHKVKSFDLASGQDICNLEEVKKAVKGIDVVYHLAAELDESSPSLFRVNVDGTRNILDACTSAGVKRLIFLSTVGVMGDIKKRADESTALNPKTKYEKSKAEAEKIVLSYQEILPVVVVRSAMVYGPNKYWKQIIDLIGRGSPLIGSGRNNFQMIYIEDLANAMLFFLENGEIGEIYIVAEREAHTLKEVCALIAKRVGAKMQEKSVSPFTAKIVAGVHSIKSKLTGKKSILTGPHIDRLLRERNYSTSKINSLGWKAKYSLEEGMKETIETIKKQ